jgi:hypothetical protein
LRQGIGFVRMTDSSRTVVGQRAKRCNADATRDDRIRLQKRFSLLRLYPASGQQCARVFTAKKKLTLAVSSTLLQQQRGMCQSALKKKLVILFGALSILRFRHQAGIDAILRAGLKLAVVLAEQHHACCVV